MTKLERPNLTKLTIGDWSQDGHESYDEIYYCVNYAVSDIRQAYKDSCRKTGVQFNHNTNYVNPGESNIYDQILTDYENNYIRPYEIEVLREHGVITDEYLNGHGLEETDDGICITEPEDVADIIMRFIALSMPEDFIYERQVTVCEPINGWWNSELNASFGYGIYR